MQGLTALDKAVLNIIQENFPVASRPFAVIAEQLQVTEDAVLERVRWLKSEGYIRRIGAVFNSVKLKYTSTLVALKVSPAELSEVAQVINRFPGVTHNYVRDDIYNVWFTVIAPGARELERILTQIRTETGCEDMLILPAVRRYKVNVKFSLK